MSRSFTGAVAPLQTTLDVAFAFKNSGNTPVAIRTIQTNCDCLAAGTDKKTYQPGEAGLLTARFTVGDRFGLYQRTITVLTDDGTAHKISVAVDVPELASVEPRVIEWPVGSSADEKSIEVRVAAPATIEFAEAFPTNTDFQVRFEVIDRGRHYRLFVKPVRTDVPANAAIRLKGTASNGIEVFVSAYGNVR